MKKLILVDENDNPTGTAEKIEAHERGLLHRAFSVFLYDRGRGAVLLQRRAAGKYHSGGKWSNTCCSHPLTGETSEEAVERCMADELGLSLPVVFGETVHRAGTFRYYAKLERLDEHELDHVYVYVTDHLSDSDIHLNPEEVAEIRWVALNELRDWLANRPEDFSAWFSQAFELANTVMEELA